MQSRLTNRLARKFVITRENVAEYRTRAANLRQRIAAGDGDRNLTQEVDEIDACIRLHLDDEAFLAGCPRAPKP